MYKLVCIMGESGSGKSTLEKELVDSGMFKKIISMTTRPIRQNETDEEDYYFVSDLKFQKYVLEDMMAEHTEYGTKETSGFNFKYGIDKKEFDKMKSSPCVVVVTPHGFEQLSNFVGKENVIPVYIKTNAEQRVKKTLERHVYAIESYKPEIERRLEGDKETFKDVLSIENLTVLENKYNKESFVNNLKTIINLVFFIHDRKQMISKSDEFINGQQ